MPSPNSPNGFRVLSRPEPRPSSPASLSIPVGVFGVMLGLLLVLTGGCPNSARAADPVAIDVGDKPDGEYPVVLVVKGGQVVEARPLKSIKLGGQPTPSPNPPPAPEPSAFEAEVEQKARAAITSGGTLTTGAGFCEVYFMVAAGVAETPPSIDHKRSFEAANMGTKFVLSKSGDSAKWAAFELWSRDRLQTLDAQGAFKTREDYAAVLKAVANGLSRATGYKPVGRTLLSFDLSTAAKQTSARRALGILDGIDLDKLMEWIEFIVKLFSLFAPK